MAWRRGALVAAAAVAVSAGGCGGDGGAGAATTTTAPARSTTTATTEATTTTATTAPAIEPPANTGTDMVAILQSLSDFGNRLDMWPSREAVDLAYHPGSPAHQAVIAITDSLVAHGYRWSAPREVLSEIRDTGAVTDRTWSLTAVSRSSPEAVLVDAAGNAVGEQPPPSPPTRFVYELVLGDDGRWRFGTIQYLAEAS